MKYQRPAREYEYRPATESEIDTCLRAARDEALLALQKLREAGQWALSQWPSPAVFTVRLDEASRPYDLLDPNAPAGFLGGPELEPDSRRPDTEAFRPTDHAIAWAWARIAALAHEGLSDSPAERRRYVSGLVTLQQRKATTEAAFLKIQKNRASAKGPRMSRPARLVIWNAWREVCGSAARKKRTTLLDELLPLVSGDVLDHLHKKRPPVVTFEGETLVLSGDKGAEHRITRSAFDHAVSDFNNLRFPKGETPTLSAR